MCQKLLECLGNVRFVAKKVYAHLTRSVITIKGNLCEATETKFSSLFELLYSMNTYSSFVTARVHVEVGMPLRNPLASEHLLHS